MGVPLLFNSATFSGSRRSNAAAKITRVEGKEQSASPAKPPEAHQKDDNDLNKAVTGKEKLRARLDKARRAVAVYQ